MAYPGASVHAPAGDNVDFSDILPCRILLDKRKDSPPIPAVLERLDKNDTETKGALAALLNYEICVGRQSYPFENEFSLDQAIEYYMSFDCFVLFDEEKRQQKRLDAAGNRHIVVVEGKDNSTGQRRQFDFGAGVIAAVHIRPNFPGRSCHISNGAFLAVPQYRGSGGATVLGSFFPVLAKRLGYRATLFNLVFEENVASVNLWQKLKYEVVGRVEGAGRVVRRGSNGELVMQEGGTVPQEVWSAAIMFSVQLDDDHVIALDKNNDSSSLRRELTLSDIEARIKVAESKFGSFLLA